jgi:hypothetical protein
VSVLSSRLKKTPRFVLHQTVPRKFRVVCGDIVLVVDSWRVRFRCLDCQKTFTDYPPFAIPYKRFVKSVVLEHVGTFLENDQATYQQATRGEFVPLSYENSTDGKQLSPSTVWRWTTWLGSMKHVLQQAAQLIFEKDPQDDFHRKVYPMPARKCRGPGREVRRELLQDAARLLFAAFPRMKKLFGIDLFTAFAISPRG